MTGMDLIEILEKIINKVHTCECSFNGWYPDNNFAIIFEEEKININIIIEEDSKVKIYFKNNLAYTFDNLSILEILETRKYIEMLKEDIEYNTRKSFNKFFNICQSNN